MSREYSENVLVQNSAGNLLQNVLGWEVVMAYNSEKLGPDGTLGRTSYGEVLLTRYFRQALLRLNPWLTPNQLDEVQKKFTAHVSTASLMQINEEKYFLLRDGIPVTVKRPDGRTEIRSAAVIDFKKPENNHFLAVKEMKIHSQLYRCRTDIVGFVNGIPLLFIELKKPTVDVQNAYIGKISFQKSIGTSAVLPAWLSYPLSAAFSGSLLRGHRRVSHADGHSVLKVR